jgi:hypothetical protein
MFVPNSGTNAFNPFQKKLSRFVIGFIQAFQPHCNSSLFEHRTTWLASTFITVNDTLLNHKKNKGTEQAAERMQLWQPKYALLG